MARPRRTLERRRPGGATRDAVPRADCGIRGPGYHVTGTPTLEIPGPEVPTETESGTGKELAALVPDYLPDVPQDPFSGKPLIYRRDGAGYVLYSVGPDGQDDGGQTAEYVIPGTDIVLDHRPDAE